MFEKKNKNRLENNKVGLWIKRDPNVDRFIEIKKTSGHFKGVRRED